MIRLAVVEGRVNVEVADEFPAEPAEPGDVVNQVIETERDRAAPITRPTAAALHNHNVSGLTDAGQRAAVLETILRKTLVSSKSVQHERIEHSATG